MPTKYTFRNGDSLVRIAQEAGFRAATVWNAPENAELRKRRGDMNCLCPGDEVVIPDKQLKSVSVQTDQVHTFKRIGVPAVLRARIVRFGRPYANQPYALIVGSRRISGTTDADGILREFVDSASHSATLHIGPDEFEMHITLGHMRPVKDTVGLQRRLKNLRLYDGKVDGQMGPRTREALREFQRLSKLQPTGQLDASTEAALNRIHDRLREFEPSPLGAPEKPDHPRLVSYDEAPHGT